MLSGTSCSAAIGIRSRPRRITKVPCSTTAAIPPRETCSVTISFSPYSRAEKSTMSAPVRSRIA